jgi:hypothetical protein
LAESTQDTHPHNFKEFVSPRWGKLALPEVRVLALNVWFKELGKSLAHETLQKLKATFHRVLEYGMENELIPLAENPAELRGWKMPQWSSKWSGKMSEVCMLLIGA